MQLRIPLLAPASRLIAIALSLFGAGLAYAQIPNLTASTATPLPEHGHSYISARLPQGDDAVQVFGGGVSEFVNPATGSVSWRICTTPPKGRQLSIPFCFVYDFAGVHHLENNAPGNPSWNTDASYLEQGGWTYSLPELTEVTRQEVNGSYVCDYATDYMFRDSEGGRHAMGLSIFGPAPGAPANSCSQVQPAPGGVTTGGEGAILATTSEPSGSFSLQPVTVTDADGTRYIFNDPGRQALANGFTAELPDVIEDRNGNEITLTDSGSGKVTATDTVGRAAVATSGFGASAGDSVQIAGESAAYTVDWGTAASSYSVDSTSESGTCTVPGTVSGSQPVVTSIELPDGESFTFQYDATYGLLDRVTFPTGGYVRYVWGMNAAAEGGQFASTSGTCLDRYGEPAITARYVSLDGSSEVLDQSFAYATTWPSSGAAWSSNGHQSG
ncbi:MAG: hypothetical protein EPN33_12315 [Acidobacteria bacterium]|nr:MAG: hypothetical protein EPN33_12315 [Acidobacteriota bacterium]